MPALDLVLRSRRAVTPEGERPAAVCVAGERVTAVETHEADPGAAQVADQRLHHKNPLTPYDGRPLRGVVRGTWLRGQELDGDRPQGRLLTRGGA
jgi:dihydroorotase-like cyclic amidohydrolase